MRKTTSKTKQKEVSGLHLTLPAIAAEDLFTLVHSVGMQALQQLLEMERTQLCGPRYEHDQERATSRHGTTQGASVLGGRRVRVQRPRVRSRDGREVPLPTWERFSQEDPLLTIEHLPSALRWRQAVPIRMFVRAYAWRALLLNEL